MVGSAILGVAAAKAMRSATRRIRALIRVKKARANAAQQAYIARPARETAVQASALQNSEGTERGNRAQRPPGYSPALRERQALLLELRRLAGERGLTGSQQARLIITATKEGLRATDTGRIDTIIREVEAGDMARQQSASSTPAPRRPVPETRQGDGPKPRLTRITPEKPSDLIRTLQRFGFREDPNRGKGDHRIFVHPDGRTVPVPNYKGEDLTVSLVEQIIREVGITREEYLRAKER